MGAKRPTIEWRAPVDDPGARLLLVIGCPRSGTRSFARMLQNAGVRVGHERVGIHGTVSSYFAVDDDYYQGPHQATRDRLSAFRFEHLWHIVRDPLATISSISFGMPPSWWDWQRRHTWIDREKIGALGAACEFVLKWTDICEKANPEWVVRIEDWKEKWPEVARRLGIEVEPLPDFSKANALHPKPKLTYDILSEREPVYVERIRKLASRYGYDS